MRIGWFLETDFRYDNVSIFEQNEVTETVSESYFPIDHLSEANIVVIDVRFCSNPEIEVSNAQFIKRKNQRTKYFTHTHTCAKFVLVVQTSFLTRGEKFR